MPANPAVESYLTQLDICNIYTQGPIDEVGLYSKPESFYCLNNWLKLSLTRFRYIVLIILTIPSVVAALRVGGTKFLAVLLLKIVK